MRCRCRKAPVRRDDTTSRTGSGRRSRREEERVAEVEGQIAQKRLWCQCRCRRDTATTTTILCNFEEAKEALAALATNFLSCDEIIVMVG